MTAVTGVGVACAGSRGRRGWGNFASSWIGRAGSAGCPRLLFLLPVLLEIPLFGRRWVGGRWSGVSWVFTRFVFVSIWISGWCLAVSTFGARPRSG